MNAENKRAKLITALSAGETGPVPAAIIGVSGYFPQSNDVHAFWGAIDADRPLIEEIPSSRFDRDRFFDPAGKDPNKSRSCWGGLIPDIRSFDAGFFHILPDEADRMDPRKRLLLMSVQHALEDAGYAGKALRDQRVGVFVAAEEDEFRQCLLEKGIDTRTGGGNSSSLLANQISYFFDFRGPSELVNTMCSGAAVAIHRAVNALRNGEISYAVVCAANLLLHPDPFVYLSRSGQMSPEPTVRSFGRDAKGFCRAEGVASIILKLLPAARADKDSIYASIRHTAVNYNGQGGLSMAAPNIPAHTDVIYSCYKQAGIDARRVGYIEAQGMGNPVADIAEWEAFNLAIKKIAGESGLPWRPYSCRVSTLKPITGHMHSASALGALLRIIRTFQTNKAHGIAGFTAPSPDLVIKDQPCRLLTDPEDWPEEAEPRLAGLHSYGSGGNNAHLLIEEYKEISAPAACPTGKLYVIPCSAKSTGQCRAIASRLAAMLQEHPEYSPASIAFTLQTGRTALEARVAFVAGSTVELIRLLQAYAAEQSMMGIYTAIPGAAPTIGGDRLEDAARAWAEGADIVWEQQAFFAPAARLHLPVYPFQYAEHWPITGPDIPAMAPSPGIESVIRECLAKFLKMPPERVDLDQQFSAMGFDSLLVTELSRQLGQRLNVQLQAGVYFEYTTPAALIGFIMRQPVSGDSGGRAASSDAIKPARVSTPGEDADAIAVVGLAGSYPQSPDINTFWNNLLAGRNCIEEVPSDRWSLSEHYDGDREEALRTGKSYAKWGGFLQDLYCFDPLFFHMAPSEAATMNPKERIFLQCAWHVLEDAGYTPGSLASESVGVFAGVTRSGLDPYRVSAFPVANRVSYTFNFQGPSMVIDTACSSSLIAIHEACSHILSGECTVALAGGVHAFLDPSHFAALASLQMLSPDGVSRSFGEHANGMAPGEGVGAVLLKPLSKAIADHDHIYGIVRGSSSNHGGKSNGFTVPKPGAHTDLIRAALKKAGVHAREISYTEAHGTGTALGDPIEIRGLTEAFRVDASDKQYCSLGSVKSNIGHLEAAAGVSGLTKVLLQMRHGKLVPSLHARRTNPQIDLLETPFVVQQEVSDWKPVDRDGQPLPLIACVSSFGAGGSNAHLIVQEHVRENRPAPSVQPVLIMLSARNVQQLRQRVKQLVAFLSEAEDRNGLLADIAYTLQIGREAMEERLAAEVEGIKELMGMLQGWLDGQGDQRKLFRGTVHRKAVDEHREPAAPDHDTIDGRRALLSRWIDGYPVDWTNLYTKSGRERPSRISLPSYPFEKEYFGPPVMADGRRASDPGAYRLHPLVHYNESTFASQVYSSLFTGEEPFLKDHVVEGVRTLPGVAYLEMARAAFHLAHEEDSTPRAAPAFLLRNIGWARPVTVTGRPEKLFIRLWPTDGGEFGFSINGQGDDMLHCQGAIARLSYGAVADGHSGRLDLERIRRQLNRGMYTGVMCYQEFSRMGISYGPSHRALQSIQVGEGQLLAKLFVPDAPDNTTHALFQSSAGVYLHPGIMDAATQAIMGYLVMGRKAEDPLLPLAVPYALQELRVHRSCGKDMWAYIRCQTINSDANDGDIHSLRFDIDICDASGELAVQVKGFISRTIQQPSEVLFMRPAWIEKAVVRNAAPPAFGRHVVVGASSILAGLSATPSILPITMEEHGGEKDLLPQALIEQVFGIVQDQLRSGLPTMTQLLLPAHHGGGCRTAISGLLKSAARENPNFRGQVITFDRDIVLEDIPSMLLECSNEAEEQDIRYKGGRRWVSRLEEFAPPSLRPGACWKDKGVYLITGGAGGLGYLFAEEIARRAKEAMIVLSGRSAMNFRIGQLLEALRREGASVEYRQTNVAAIEEVTHLITDIEARYGRLDGILHAAGVVRDGFIIRKTMPEVREALAPKVQGVMNLDEASRHLPLDHFILFSSVSGVMGNAGQSDYAVANAFLDVYAGYRQSMVAAGLRSGRTLAVSWPFWSKGGMEVPAIRQEELKQRFGMTPLQTSAGMEAFYRLAEANETRAMVVQGDAALLRKAFLYKTTVASRTVEEKNVPADEVSAGNHEDALYFFKKILSKAIGLSADRIDATKPMEEYGIDSLMVMKMTAEMEKVFGSLSKTLFFEYASISELANYFLSHYGGQLKKLLNQDAVGEGDQRDDYQRSDHQHGQRVKGERESSPVYAKSVVNRIRPANEQQEGIAIIGLSGQYPQARNLDIFWENIVAGRNCITEIPEDRWDHSLYFDADNKKPFKTNTKWGGFLEGMREFDPLFFNISFKEAETIDPQERLFLQSAYAAIEDAGYTRQRLSLSAGKGNVGVYVGVMWNEYQLLAAGEIAHGRPMVLSSGSSSIANRVSYYCNFNGPSIAVDTMCSSSLTAIHLACQSLHSGECGIAIAGGVNVSIHPNKYLILGYSKMASSKGLCESFGREGDGYVPSEGVGTVVLKPLSRAIADGDHVYGVIRGSAINHGGKVNGYSVPNPKAQAQAISRALEQAQWDPRTVSYIEAHGTGTALGDPIEIAALSNAFQATERQFCAIGSVKSNIGHCESAAGIAGLSKVLLQMKHGILAPSLHSCSLNENIDFENSPFRVQQEAAEWKRWPGRAGASQQEQPRRAGISSFGAGGSNAHLAVEEFLPLERGAAFSGGSGRKVAIVLSARDEVRLKEVALGLLSHLRNKVYADTLLDDIAYTLQTGREAMEQRIAMEVSTIADLEEKLFSYVEGRPADQTYIGKQSIHKDLLSIFTSDQDMELTLESWFKKRKYSYLLGLWVNGIQLDWEKLYGADGPRPRRMSLPGYPFSREQYWPITGRPAVLVQSAIAQPVGVRASIHPLLHENTSTLSQQQFTSTFTGQEFFLDDHRINGEKTLPGVACIEMVREAVRRSSIESDGFIRLENMAWAEPITVNGLPASVDVLLTPGYHDVISFEISSRKAVDEKPPVVHTRGAVRCVEAMTPPRLHVEKIIQTLTGPAIAAEACYNFFTRMGIWYGPGHRAIEHIITGGTELLARLHLPAAASSGFYLHPGVMDAAFQAIAAFWIPCYHDNDSIPLMVPFAAREIDILAPCPESAWAYVRWAGDTDIAGKAQPSSQYSFDVDVSDADGNICVQVRGLMVRQMSPDVFPGLLLLEHCWRVDQIRGTSGAITGAERYVVQIGSGWQAGGVLENGLAITVLQAADLSPAAAFEFYATGVFNEVKKILRGGPRSPVIMQVLISTAGDQAVHSALAGLFKTAKWENPLFTGQVIACDTGMGYKQIMAVLDENLKAPADAVIRYSGGQREVLSLKEARAPLNLSERPWREGGIYLITGGAGGLGLLFAQEIASSLKNGIVVLAGRSPMSPALEQRLSNFSASAVRVLYRPADITDAGATQQLIQHIVAEFGGLNGVIHSAGVLDDNLILRKESSAIGRVLAPKVHGTVNLDSATAALPLDLFLCCSSVTGATGNAGQSDYAMANAFQDAYAAWRQGLVDKGERQGKSLSIGWPLWEDGGMQIGEERKAILLDRYGMETLSTAAGMHALTRAMAMTASAVMVLEGNPAMLRDMFLTPHAAEPGLAGGGDAAAGQDKVSGMRVAESWLKGILSEAVKVPAERIRSDRTMEEYGIDSVTIMQMTYEMEKRFGNLSKTLFFEYRTVEELAAYFIKTFPGQWVAAEADHVSDRSTVQGNGAIQGSDPIQGSDAVRTADKRQHPTRIPMRGAQKTEKQVLPPSKPGSPDIAIIGLAGRYPGAGNLEEFWKILREGVNCVTEIPRDRWDHSRYFDEEKNKDGRTYGKWGGFIDGVDVFDAAFFNITPKEAETMDPQERLFLECAYEAMEDAGYTRDTLGAVEGVGKGGQVGVFVGVMTEEYQLYGATETAQGRPLALGGNTAAIANRISYFCNFNGPSIALNTMCSSSLTSIHLACQSLMTGECRAAIAGGVNVTVHPNKYLALAYGGFLSSKGLCESFGASGDGYVPAEGVGVVVLKPLAQAIADRDQIYGVIKGSSINHGGRTNGNTVPNPAAQASVIANAIAASGFDPRTINYLEAHGTGTSLGDPIEINGLIRGFDTSERQYCAIGSVKSNIGHGESAAGIAGLTKVLLQMKYGLLAPSLHSESPNPHIDFANSPFRLQRELSPWHRPELVVNGVSKIYPRRAGISSFGAGGANAHLLVEEFIGERDARPEETADPGVWGIRLCARNEEQLKALALRMVKWVEGLANFSVHTLADMAFTLDVGRELKEETLLLQVSSFGELTKKLNQYINEGIKENSVAIVGGQEAMSINRGYRPRRISLPTYPFMRRRCWFDEPSEISVGPASSVSSSGAEKWLTGLITHALKMDISELRPDKAFQDHGIDSIMITQLLRPIRESLGKDIDPSILFEYSTVRQFACWLQATYPGELAAIVRGEEVREGIAPDGEGGAGVRAGKGPLMDDGEESTAGKSVSGKVPVAVVGMSCRFPGAGNVDEFWRLLREGRSAIRPLSSERRMDNVEGYAGIIDRAHHFDPGFFLLAEDDARAMDPQALLVLEESLSLWHHAGYIPEEIRGKNVGVYIGGRGRNAPSSERFERALNPAMATGQNYLSCNISRFFDLRGPSVVIDTACSSALVAMKMAVQALQGGETEAAIVGGVNLLQSGDTWQLFRKRGLLSDSQDFHILDRRAGGIILGEGVGMVLLKTVEQALKDGDTIYAVIDSLAINNDGRSAGPATPNIAALRTVMQRALRDSGKRADEIGYLEVNGSGSEITDLIEIKAVDAIYGSSGGVCRLGSLKPNIGHPLAAEGIAAFIKVVCMLHHRQIVPFLSGQESMRHFDLTASPFLFARQLTSWPEGPATAAINCFADGGTNAHVIVEAWTGDKDQRATRRPLSSPSLEHMDMGVEHPYESVWETFE